MNLNLPILDQLADSKSILIAGMGGGFDVFCGLPIYFELKAQGYNVHLANYSFSAIVDSIKRGRGGVKLTDTLMGVTPDIDFIYIYFPELYLTQWFKEKHNEDVTVWAFHKTGARTLLADYQILVEHLDIDTILLIDGGVDGLLRGDEAGLGTLIEDTVSLIAVNELENVPLKMVVCTAFGAERDIAYGHVMENIAQLTRQQAFFGTCSLLSQMDCYKLYEDAVLYVQDKPHQDSSVINSSLVSSVQGHYGDYHLTDKTRGSVLWISPLMSLYWFFDLHAIARRNMLYDHLRYTDTREEMFRAGVLATKHILSRGNKGREIRL